MPQVVEHGSYGRLERKALFARRVSSAELEDLFVRRREPVCPDAHFLEGLHQRLMGETAHGGEDDPNLGVAQRKLFALRGDDDRFAVHHGCHCGPKIFHHCLNLVLALQLPVIVNDVQEGLDPRLEPCVGSVAVQFQGKGRLAAHLFPKIPHDEGIGTTGEIADIRPEQLPMILDQAGRLEDHASHGPVHGRLVIHARPFVRQHVERDHPIPSRSELGRDALVGFTRKGIVRPAEQHHTHEIRILFDLPDGPGSSCPDVIPERFLGFHSSEMLLGSGFWSGRAPGLP